MKCFIIAKHLLYCPVSLYISGAVGGTPSDSAESHEMIHIGSIDIDIVRGDLTQEGTDAIVNCTNRTLDLSKCMATACLLLRIFPH